MDTNLVVLTGRLTKDVELTYSQAGMAIGKFGLAVQGYKKGADRENQPVHFFNVTCFGKTAEIVKENTTKGYRVMVLGSLSLDQWEDRDTGAKRSAVKIIARQVELWFGKKLGGQEAAGEERQSHPKDEPQADPEEGGVAEGEQFLSELSEDAIPF